VSRQKRAVSLSARRSEVRKANHGFFTVGWSEWRAERFESSHAADDNLETDKDLALLPEWNDLVVRMM
jgi:hypothetical protein